MECSSKYLIIVAGGRGERMRSDLPKQFLPLKGKPILMRTIQRFKETYPELKTILVLHPNYVEQWKELCREHQFPFDGKIALGGSERFYSVKNGLDQIDETREDSLVAIHDAVRPLVSTEVIRRTFEKAAATQAAIPALPSIESVRILNDDSSSQSIARHRVMMVQTPQVFSLSLLKKAYAQPYEATFTDDASVVESLGHKITIVEGNRENIKLTTPQDVELAQLLLSSEEKE